MQILDLHLFNSLQGSEPAMTALYGNFNVQKYEIILKDYPEKQKKFF